MDMTRQEWLEEGRALIRDGRHGQQHRTPMVFNAGWWIRWEIRAWRWKRLGLEKGWTHE